VDAVLPPTFSGWHYALGPGCSWNTRRGLRSLRCVFSSSLFFSFSTGGVGRPLRWIIFFVLSFFRPGERTGSRADYGGIPSASSYLAYYIYQGFGGIIKRIWLHIVRFRTAGETRLVMVLLVTPYVMHCAYVCVFV
jgi:hypothetical protein